MVDLLTELTHAYHLAQTNTPLNSTTTWVKWEDLPESVRTVKMGCMRTALLNRRIRLVRAHSSSKLEY